MEAMFESQHVALAPAEECKLREKILMTKKTWKGADVKKLFEAIISASRLPKDATKTVEIAMQGGG